MIATTTRSGRTTPTAPEPVPPLGARAAVLASGVCGVLALFSTGLIATPHVAVFATACIVMVAAATWAPVVWPSEGGTLVRRMISFTILAITLVLFVVNLLRLEPSRDVDVVVTFGGFLARLLISVLLAQLFVTDKMRDLRVALSLAVGMFVFALANDPGWFVVVALLVGWPAVVAALAFDHAARDRLKADAVARSPQSAQITGWGRVGSFAAVSGLVAVLVALLVPHPSGVGPHRNGGFAGDGAPVSRTGAPSRDAETYTSGTLDMRTRGDLPDTEVAEVPGDSPVLWRGAVLDYYDGISWRAPSDSSYGLPLVGGPHFALPPTDPTLGTGAERRDVVHRRAGFTGVLLAPGQPTAVDVAGQLLHLSGGFFVAKAPGQDYPENYSVTSTATDRPRSQLSQTPIGMAVGQEVPGHALQVSSTVPERVHALAKRITRWAPDRGAATRAVEIYLRAHATYRLDSPVPPPGADAVDHFLFVAHTGFCEQFAAAEVVLLRAAGVPARLATGFAGGEPSGDHRTLRGSDAHAWVEVWYPNLGWVASDPTAGARRADAGLADRVSAWLHDAAGRVVVASCILAAAALVTLSLWWLRRRARRAAGRRGARRPDRALPPVLAAFDRLQHALNDVGTPRAPAESVGELARRPAMFEAAGALAVVERTSYGARAPVGAEADEAERTLNALAHQLRADHSAAER